MRSKKAMFNTVSALSYEVVAVICGLILPRLILSSFGSSYNGITSSITQFLTCVVLLRAGVGGVTRAALYKPLADKDNREISAIIRATEIFMRRVAIIFIFALFVFAAVYPFLVKDEFEWLFSFTLVLILGISTFVQYYFGITYQMLLQADQCNYVISTIQICTTILNTAIAAILIKSGCSIHIVKLGSAVVFSLNPIVTNIYCRKKYKIDRTVKPNQNAIKQRWDAFSQTVAFFVHNNTDVMVLTCFASTKEVSVYTVYNYVIANLQNIISTFVSGFGAAFGNMFAKNEKELIHKNLRIYELIVFGSTSVIYSVAGVMIVPFALVYTSGINDVNYSRPLFAMLVTIAGSFACFRLPYQTIVEAVGHFKQTKNGAIFEAGLNIVLSIILVIKFGMVGVAVGTLVATVFRSFQYAFYLSKKIVSRSIFIFIGHIVVNAVVAVITYLSSRFLFDSNVENWWQWIVLAVEVTLVSIASSGILHFVFYHNDVKNLLEKLKGMLKRRGDKNA